MLNYFTKYFRLGIYLFFVSSHLVCIESLELDRLLNVFTYCAIHIYNYRGLTLSPFGTPATLYLKTPFQIEPNIYNYETTRPVQCHAAIYILPTAADKTVPGKGRNNGGYYSSRIPKQKRIQIRYDVLVDDSKQQSRKVWASAYSSFLKKSLITSFGLITEIKEYSSYLSDKLEIIHIFQVAPNQKLVTTSMSIKEIYSIYQLYHAIMNIHGIGKNKDVQWTLISLPGGRLKNVAMFLNQHKTNLNRVQKMFKMNLTSPAYVKLLQPTKVSEEGMENIHFALTLLGGDVNLTKSTYGRRMPQNLVNPRITFNVPQSTVMMDSRPRQSAYVSCSTAGGPIIETITFPQAAIELLSIFEDRIYFGLIATYVAPPILLGLLYHFLLKKRIKKQYWVSWHPFAWGIRAIIWQAGDRRFNSSRFGWTVFMVVPLLLVAVVISYVFRQHVLFVIGSGSRLIYPWNVLERQYQSGVTMVTDNERLAMELRSDFYADSFDDIVYQLMENDKITYISWANRVNAVAKAIGHHCPNSWQPVKYGHVYSWDLRFLGRYVGYHALESELSGWEIEKWVDNSIWYRLSILNGESGIFGKWRETLERLNDYRPRRYGGMGWVTRISMNTNVIYLFYCGAGGFVVALVIWIAEWVFFKAYTQPRRKWKKQMDNVRKIIVGDELREIGDSGRGSINSGGGIQDELVNEAVLLVDEQRRTSLQVGQMVKEDLKEDDNEMVRTNVDVAQMDENVTEIGELGEGKAEVENPRDPEDQTEDLEIIKNVDILEKSGNVIVHVEHIDTNPDVIEIEELVGLQDSCEEIESLMVEQTRSTEVTVSVTRSESRVSFADPLETIIEPKSQMQNEGGNNLGVQGVLNKSLDEL